MPRDLDLIIALAPRADGPDADAETAHLAGALAATGTTLPRRDAARDVASTGGPSSLTTLLCPLVQVADGAVVPKLAVTGRPAGGVDTLATVPGYAVELSAAQVERALDICGYAHFAASATWAPGDAALFARRKARGAQQLPRLAAASLLAKKLAAGVSHVILDVRVSAHGNFGSDAAAAAENAEMFVRVGALAGVAATCVLSDGELPQQPALGRGESLAAVLDVVEGTAGPWLRSHADDCAALARHGRLAEHPAAAMLEALAANLAAQGSSLDALRARVAAVRAQPRIRVHARVAGTARADLARLRDLLVAEQNLAAPAGYADPAGLTLLVRPGTSVHEGDPIADVRAADPDRLPALAARVSECLLPGPQT
jgi:thymidine phosphorylase